MYRDAVGQSIPQLTADTPLIDILSTLNGKDILYCTIEQIVCNAVPAAMPSFINFYRLIRSTTFLKA